MLHNDGNVDKKSILNRNRENHVSPNFCVLRTDKRIFGISLATKYIKNVVTKGSGSFDTEGGSDAKYEDK